MKRTIKRSLSVLLIIALLLCPMTVFAGQLQGTIKWYYHSGDVDRYDELSYYGELTIGENTVNASEIDNSDEYVFKMTVQDAGWYYMELDANKSSISTLRTQKEIREDGMPCNYSADGCLLVFEEGDKTKSITGAVLHFDAEETRYLDFYYSDNDVYTIDIEYLGEMIDVVPEQGMLDNLVPDKEFRIIENTVCIDTGNFTAKFSGGKSFALNTNAYPYSGEISIIAGRYDMTLDFAGFKKELSISVYDLSAAIDHVVIENLDELEEKRMVVYYDGFDSLEGAYEADITVYFKDGTVSKASCGSDGVTAFTAPNGREYCAYALFVRNGGDCDIVLKIDVADYVETVGKAVLSRASLSQNLRIFRYNFENQKDAHRTDLFLFFLSELMSVIIFSFGKGEL